MRSFVPFVFLVTVLSTLCAVPGSAQTGAGGSVQPAVATPAEAAKLDAGCWKVMQGWYAMEGAAQKRHGTYVLKDHPDEFKRLIDADQQCEGAVSAVRDNPTYGIHAGFIELALTTGAAPGDALHVHGMSYLHNALYFAFHQNDPSDILWACRVNRAFYKDGDFQCADADVARAQQQVDAQEAAMTASAAAAQRAATAQQMQQLQMLQMTGHL